MTDPVLVTGAPGNVGTPLVRELVARGASVRVAARHVDAAHAAFGELPGVEVVPFDLTDPSSFGAFEGAERMFLLRPPAIADVKGVIAPALDSARAWVCATWCSSRSSNAEQAVNRTGFHGDSSSWRNMEPCQARAAASTGAGPTPRVYPPELIEEHRDAFGVEPIRQALAIAPSTYYAARSRPPSARAVRDGAITPDIARIHTANHEVHGVRKVWHSCAATACRSAGTGWPASWATSGPGAPRAAGASGRRSPQPWPAGPPTSSASGSTNLVQHPVVPRRPSSSTLC